MLNDIKVLDFTRLLPGPLATHLLALMGAEIIKIESPQRLDPARYSGIPIDGASPLFHILNHKKSIRTIDYQSPEGRDEIYHLIGQCDVLIEQFRPGAMDSWQIGFQELRSINPSLIYASLTGYGQDTTRAGEAGHDINYLCRAGMMSLLTDESGQPVIPGFQLADIGGGSYMVAMAVSAALYHRKVTGQGVRLDISMTDGLIPLLTVPLSLRQMGLDHRQYNMLDGKTAVNYSMYQCADGRWLSVGAVEVKFWNNLCEVLDKPEWKRDNALELINTSFNKSEVEALFKSKPCSYWVQLFDGHDVCVAPVEELEDVMTDPYHDQRKNFVSHILPSGKEIIAPGLPFRFDVAED